MLSSLLRRTVVMLAIATPLALSSSAGAAPVQINGDPMIVWVGEQGQMQAKLSSDTSNIFYNPTNPNGDAGFFLAFPAVAGQHPTLQGKTFGFDGSAGPSGLEPYVAVSQGPVTGDGSAGNPFTQVTSYAVTDSGTPTPINLLTVTQTTRYVNGNQTFLTHWDVTNLTAQPVPFKALTAADFFFEGSDRGTGIFTQGPPRFVGGTNADTGRSGGFVESLGAVGVLPPWSAYQALVYGSGADQVWGLVQAAAATATPSFNNTVNGESEDNAGGVEWDQALTAPLAVGATMSFELVTRTALPSALQFDQTNAGAPQGVPITFTVTAKDTSGVPYTGKTVRYTITGANSVPAGTAVIDAAGTARLVDPGTVAGPDTLIAYLDLNGNGVREPNEPQGSALATFVDQTPPSCRVAVSGDRVGSGGVGKPLVITVNCDSPATVTTATTFSITPVARAATASTAAKKKPAKKKKVKKVVRTLAAVTATVQPGVATPLSIKVPATIAKRYPGATVVATVTVTAVDAAGNRATATAKRSIKIAKAKAKAKKKKKVVRRS
jgi:hypothetical protein